MFIAPEVIDRLIGFERIEAASERLIERLSSFAREMMTNEGETPLEAAPLLLWTAWTCYSILATAAVVAIGAGGWANPMWWLTGNGLILLPALLGIAAMAGIMTVTAFLFLISVDGFGNRPQGLFVGAVLTIVVVPILIIAFSLATLATPILIGLEFLVRRLQAGWVRATFLVVGLTSVVVELALQFASTF